MVELLLNLAPIVRDLNLKPMVSEIMQMLFAWLGLKIAIANLISSPTRYAHFGTPP